MTESQHFHRAKILSGLHGQGSGGDRGGRRRGVSIFESQGDNRIDRATYFRRCWKNWSETRLSGGAS
jgi:hypothetical protein